MKLKRFLVPGVVAALLAVGLTMPIGADDNEITTTVTPLVLSVTVDVGSIDYGALPFSLNNIERSKAESQPITVTNNGSVVADIRLQGAHATAGVPGQDDWTISCDPAATGTVAEDVFAHRFGFGDDPDFMSGGISALCADSHKLLASDVAINGQVPFVLEWVMPTDTDGYGPRSSSVTVLAVQ